MSQMYEVREFVHSETKERYWKVFDWSQERLVSVRFNSLDQAERCRNALMQDDQRDAVPHQ
jgi:hypothetical protein